MKGSCILIQASCEKSSELVNDSDKNDAHQMVGMLLHQKIKLIVPYQIEGGNELDEGKVCG